MLLRYRVQPGTGVRGARIPTEAVKGLPPGLRMPAQQKKGSLRRVPLFHSSASQVHPRPEAIVNRIDDRCCLMH